MRVCLIATELFLWGKAGGYGRATRMIGRELVRRGVEVCAVVPTPRGQPAQASLDVDGIRVLSFTPEKAASSKALYAQCDADIYHSQEATLGSYFAMRAMHRPWQSRSADCCWMKRYVRAWAALHRNMQEIFRGSVSRNGSFPSSTA